MSDCSSRSLAMCTCNAVGVRDCVHGNRFFAEKKASSRRRSSHTGYAQGIRAQRAPHMPWGDAKQHRSRLRFAPTVAMYMHALKRFTYSFSAYNEKKYTSPHWSRKKKENRHAKRGMGRGQGPHLHEQDFGRTIRGTGGALLLLTRDTTGSQRGARWTPTSTGGLISV